MAKTAVAVSTITVEFSGAWLRDSGDGKVSIDLQDIELREVPFDDIRRVTDQLYSDRNEAAIMADRVAQMLGDDLMVRALAKRVQRVG